MVIIIEDYVSFEVAKFLKDKGFNEKCFALYNPDGTLIQSGIRLNNIQVGRVEGSYSAPTLQMVMKWLREVYELYIEISLSCDREDKNTKIFDISIFNLQNQRYKKLGNIQGYEQAVEAAIKYCLKNLI